MNVLKITAILGILVPSLVFAQGTTIQAVSTQTTVTGIEREDIGVTGETEDSTSKKGNVDVQFKVEEGESASPDGDSDRPVISGSVQTTDKATPKLMEAATKGTNDDGETDDSMVLEVTQTSAKGDSFFDVFVDLHDDDTKASVDAFIKIGDIKGESTDDKAEDGDDAGDVTFGDGATGTRPASANKPKEIVVVGSKVRNHVKVKNVEVRGWDPIKKEVTISPDDIDEGKDFLDFIGATVVAYENIEQVSFNFEKITVKYDQQAKLLGFIGIKLKATAEIDEQGAVKIKFPWFRFLTRNNGTELRNNIEGALSGLPPGAYVYQNNQTNLDFLRNRAQIVQAITNAMVTK